MEHHKDASSVSSILPFSPSRRRWDDLAQMARRNRFSSDLNLDASSSSSSSVFLKRKKNINKKFPTITFKKRIQLLLSKKLILP